MRALLVVNPAATTTSARTRDVLIHALASEMKLEAVTTEYRGHARDLGRQAAESEDIDLVVALGGDGTVNEVVNGLLHAGPDPERLPAPRRGPRRLHQRLRPRPGPAQRRRGGDRRPAGRPARGQRTHGRPGAGRRARRAPRTRPCPRAGSPSARGSASTPAWSDGSNSSASAAGDPPMRSTAPGRPPVPRRAAPPARHDHAGAARRGPGDRSGAVHSLQHLSLDLPGQSPDVRVA